VRLRVKTNMANSTPQSGKDRLGDSSRPPDFQPPIDGQSAGRTLAHPQVRAYRDLVLLGGFCLFLSAMDHLIPKPLPFMRIGLANLPLLIALDIFSAKNFFLLAVIKTLGQGLVTGTLFTYVALFSLTGTMLSAALMFVLRRAFSTPAAARGNPAELPQKIRGMSFVGIGIAGAFMSNAAQLVLARFIVFGEGVLYLAPPFLAAGIISGGLLGFFAEKFSAQSQWLRLRRGGGAASGYAAPSPLGDAPVEKKSSSGQNFFSLRSLALLLTGLFFLFVPWLPVRAALFALFWLLALAAGKKTRPVFTIIGIVMITACNLFPPFGKILFHAGPVIIAEGSLLRGLQRAATMEGLIMFSRLALASAFPLPGKLGRLLRETFGILERLNLSAGDRIRSKSGGGKEKTSRASGGKDKTGSFLQNLDRLLCEMSGPGKHEFTCE